MKIRGILSLAVGTAVLSASPARADILINPWAGFTLLSPYSADNSGSPYWNNLSADGERCNFSYFAIGLITPGTCANAMAGSDANSAAIGTSGNPFNWWNGTYAPFSYVPGPYELTLLGGYHGRNSLLATMGCGAIFGGGCGLIEVLSEEDSWSVNSTISINYTGMVDFWGFGYYNNFNPSAGCDSAPGGVVSGYQQGYLSFCNTGVLPAPGVLPQFFAVAESDTPCAYGMYCSIVGVEDNALGLMPNGNYYDADYNDYLIKVTATPEPGSIALLATGLLGLVGAGVVRRRRQVL